MAPPHLYPATSPLASPQATQPQRGHAPPISHSPCTFLSLGCPHGQSRCNSLPFVPRGGAPGIILTGSRLLRTAPRAAQSPPKVPTSLSNSVVMSTEALVIIPNTPVARSLPFRTVRTVVARKARTTLPRAAGGPRRVPWPLRSAHLSSTTPGRAAIHQGGAWEGDTALFYHSRGPHRRSGCYLDTGRSYLDATRYSPRAIYAVSR